MRHGGCYLFLPQANLFQNSDQQGQNMKKQILTGVVATVGLLAGMGSAAFGSTVVVDRIDQGQPGGVIYGGIGTYFDTSDGGEFTLIPSDTSLLNNYASVAKVADPNLSSAVGFQSFCLEISIGYPPIPGIPTNPLNYAVSPNILNNPSETITLGTAWLYSQFAAGTLTGYAYSGSAATFGGTGWTSLRGQSAAALQAAIWYLEGQVTLSQAGGAANPDLALLTTPTGSGGLGLASLSSALVSDVGGFNVDVMNIGDPGVYQYQAQLVIGNSTSVPDGGTTVMLMGIALGGLALLKRKFA